MTAHPLALAARSLVGAPFRLHGREPTIGLDCIGVLAVALAALGRPAPLPNGYTLRTNRIAGLARAAREAGLVPAKGTVVSGDVCLVRPSPCQLHLLIATGPGLWVHAHAGLRRVVEGPRPDDWPELSRFRLTQDN